MEDELGPLQSEMLSAKNRISICINKLIDSSVTSTIRNLIKKDPKKAEILGVFAILVQIAEGSAEVP